MKTAILSIAVFGAIIASFAEPAAARFDAGEWQFLVEGPHGARAGDRPAQRDDRTHRRMTRQSDRPQQFDGPRQGRQQRRFNGTEQYGRQDRPMRQQKGMQRQGNRGQRRMARQSGRPQQFNGPRQGRQQRRFKGAEEHGRREGPMRQNKRMARQGNRTARGMDRQYGQREMRPRARRGRQFWHDQSVGQSRQRCDCCGRPGRDG